MEFERRARGLLLAREIAGELPIWLQLSLRARFLLIAAETQGPELPVHFQEPYQTAALAPAFPHWASVYHRRMQLAVLDQHIRRLSHV